MKLHNSYGIELLEASIFARRGITSGQDIMYFLESDKRFTHLPFMFAYMEDAVSRITDAIEEGEKVLIFGDKDVDGVTSTAILYGYLKKQGLDVQWRLPVGEDAYGLSIEAIDEFMKSTDGYGSLIITVDCGISNVKEIAYAREKGIDVIVTDHHNPPDELPDATLIIDPKMQDSGYPFKDISGAAVAYKLVSALRFSKFTTVYNQDITLLDIQPLSDGSFRIDCIKTRNLCPKRTFSQAFFPGAASIYNTKLADFLRGQQIFVWNEKLVKSRLAEVFGPNVDFQVFDLQPEAAKIIPAIAKKDLSELKTLSKMVKYTDSPVTEITGFYNFFVTFIEKTQLMHFPKQEEDSMQDLQLVGVAALADIMPMRNENRIFVKNTLAAINGGKTRKGLAELLARLDLSGKQITSTDLSWKMIPALNASGRMGQSNLSLELLISEDAVSRNRIANKIIELNEQRKIYVADGELFTSKQAAESVEKFNNKLCIVADERINRGVTGILASKIMQKYNVPSIAMTFTEDGQTVIGSMRSCRSCIATTFLDQFGDIFYNHGGHDAAAGFSFSKLRLEEFMSKAKQLSAGISLSEEEDTIDIDAEIPSEYITPDLLKTVDLFEPFGEANGELVFMSRDLKIQDAAIVGKSERQHLKLVFDCGKFKFPAMFWGEADRLNRDFRTGDCLNVLYGISKNCFNGNVTPQMILMDAEKK